MNRTLFGFAGGSGSGKSTLAISMCRRKHWSAVRVSQDWYYHMLSASTLQTVNLDHPSVFDWDQLKLDLHQLKVRRDPDLACSPLRYKSRPEQIQRAKLVPVDGFLLFGQHEMRSVFDFLVYCDAAETIRKKRRLSREKSQHAHFDNNEFEQRWKDKILPAHSLFVEPTREYADLVVRTDESSVEESVQTVIDQVLLVRG